MDTGRQDVIVTQQFVRRVSPSVSTGLANVTDAEGPGSGPLGGFIRAFHDARRKATRTADPA